MYVGCSVDVVVVVLVLVGVLYFVVEKEMVDGVNYVEVVVLWYVV